jgi:hypothetical protein
MNKIVEGAKEALKVAKCDHELVQDGDPFLNDTYKRTRCIKCGARFWTPVSRSPQVSETQQEK